MSANLLTTLPNNANCTTDISPILYTNYDGIIISNQGTTSPIYKSAACKQGNGIFDFIAIFDSEPTVLTDSFYSVKQQYGNYWVVQQSSIGNWQSDCSSDLPIFDNHSDYVSYITDNTPLSHTSNGGGATHIAKRTGQLKDLSSYTSDILMISGGGGGGYLVGENAYNGADAGGISGSGSNSGNQFTGYAFGQGESATNKSGGGGGYYGGYKSG